MKLYIVKIEFWTMEDYTEGRAADTNVESIYSDPQKALDHIEEIARKKIDKCCLQYCKRRLHENRRFNPNCNTIK